MALQSAYIMRETRNGTSQQKLVMFDFDGVLVDTLEMALAINQEIHSAKKPLARGNPAALVHTSDQLRKGITVLVEKA
jgi:beta-phosphoglucomutase-like phosphatase (HAD superfamily)